MFAALPSLESLGQDSPLVSVLMPLFNTEAYVREAIEAVLNESYRNLELLIADDASTDGSLAIAREIAARDSRVRVFARPTNSGAVAIVYRELAEAARGQYLIASDSDDVALPHRLATLVAVAAAHPEASLVYGTVHAVSPDLRRCHRVYDQPFCPYRLFLANFIPDGGALIRKSAYDAVGGYDPAILWAEDYHLRLRLALVGPMVHTRSLVYLYRWHRRNWTSRHYDSRKEDAFKQDLLESEAPTLVRVRSGEIRSYRDAVVAAYGLAHTPTLFPVTNFPRMLRLGLRIEKRLERSGGHVLRVLGRRLVKPTNRQLLRGWRRLRRDRPQLSPDDFRAALHEAGVRQGDTIFVHSSLAAAGRMMGGAQALVEVLQSAVGVEGRILMPTFTYACDLGSREPTRLPKRAQQFTPDMPASSEMGVVAEVFRRKPGTMRIYHPLLSLAVWGRDAAAFADEQANFDGFSAQSPLGAVYRDAKIVMLGTRLDTVTMLHLAEHLAEVPYRDYARYAGDAAASPPVRRVRVPGQSAAFEKLAGALAWPAVPSCVLKLGESHVTVIPARELVDFAVSLLRYLPDFLLGYESESCRERLRFFNTCAAKSKPAE